MLALLLLPLVSSQNQYLSFTGQTFPLYPGYTGDLRVSASALNLTFADTAVTISAPNLVGPSDCDTPDTGTPNSCGVHLHEGSTCASAGGHWYNVATDPWSDITYNDIPAEVELNFTYADAIAQRTLVFHDIAGTRIACIELVPNWNRLSFSGTLAAYPGYDTTLDPTPFTVDVTFDYDPFVAPPGNEVTMVASVQQNASNPCFTEGPTTDANSCGIHIHEGFDCDNAGGHLYEGDVDPWTNVVYGDGIVTETLALDSMPIFASVIGRTLVVHNQAGERAACVVLLRDTPEGLSLGGPLTAYPNYEGDLNVSATKISFWWDDETDDVYILYTNLVADPECASGASEAANSCGIHFHSGTSCSEHDLVLGHFYSGESDPWTSASYTDMSGEIMVQYGYSAAETMGRAFVVHDRDGTRISCTLVLPQAPVVVTDVAQIMVVYEGYESFDVSAEYIGLAYEENRVTFFYSLLQGDLDCSNADPTVLAASNACGLHIHEGFSCEPAGGHFYADDEISDPWQRAQYVSSSPTEAAMMVEYGESILATQGRVVVLHDASGNRIACAELNDYFEMEDGSNTLNISGTIDTYPGYEGDLSVSGSFNLIWSGTGVTIAYTIDADDQCESAETSANSCGIHLHTGFECPTGGHHYDEDLSLDPWQVAYYLPGTGGLVIENGLTFSETNDLSAFVIHDVDGTRIACYSIGDDNDSDDTGSDDNDTYYVDSDDTFSSASSISVSLSVAMAILSLFFRA